MADDVSTLDRCPMCGAPVSMHSPQCVECGEPLDDGNTSQEAGPKSLVEQQYARNLERLEGLLLTFGHLTWVISIIMILAARMFTGGFMAFLIGSAWIVAGYACASHKRQGILAGAIVSYFALGVSLLYWNLFGIFFSLIVSLQAHRTLRLSHRVLAQNEEA